MIYPKLNNKISEWSKLPDDICDIAEILMKGMKLMWEMEKMLMNTICTIYR